MEKERTSPWLILFRVVFTAALIACIMFIFRNSLENGAQSSARSQAVMQLVNSALAKVHLGPLSEHLIRKLAHFSEFALEGFLLMLCIRVYTKHFVRHMSWPLLGGMTTALMDETIQLHSPNRTSSVVDVWIDMSGVVAGLLFALIILLIVRGVTAFIRVKQENRALRAESVSDSHAGTHNKTYPGNRCLNQAKSHLPRLMIQANDFKPFRTRSVGGGHLPVFSYSGCGLYLRPVINLSDLRENILARLCKSEHPAGQCRTPPLSYL